MECDSKKEAYLILPLKSMSYSPTSEFSTVSSIKIAL